MSIAEKYSTLIGKIPQVYEAGKKTEYDAFWDAYQNSGHRADYRFAFAGAGWTEENFRPKYPISAHGAMGQMFNSSPIKDLKAHMDKFGITIDTSASYNIEHFFMSSNVETYGILNASSASNLNYVLFNARQLRSITKVIIKADGSQTVVNFAQNCSALEDIIIEGVIGQNGLNFQWSTKLSKASITSVINCLSTTTSGLTVTFSKTAKEAAFTDEEWSELIATKPNWTILLV